MRKFLITAALAALVGANAPAVAQDRGHHEGRDNGAHAGGNENRGGPRPDGPAPAPNPAAASGRNAIGQRDFREHRDAPSPARSAPAVTAPNAMRGNADRRDGNRRDFNRPDNRRPDFNNAMRGARPDNGPRRDFSNYRNYHQNFRAERRFRVGPYRRPQGFYSHRWSWGEFLPAPFWVRDYWLIDYFAYGLPPPPFGAIWVRVGDDALLIDRYTGEIIEVDYGVFY